DLWKLGPRQHLRVVPLSPIEEVVAAARRPARRRPRIVLAAGLGDHERKTLSCHSRSTAAAELVGPRVALAQQQGSIGAKLQRGRERHQLIVFTRGNQALEPLRADRAGSLDLP